MNKLIVKQTAILAALALGFASFNIGIYNLFTKRCRLDPSETIQAKSIELKDYLPFDESSEIVRIDSDFKITDQIPVIDGAAALYPVYSAFVNAVYPEDSVIFDGKDFDKASKMKMTNTLKAYKAVVDGDADIVICAQPSHEQLEYAEQNGVELALVPIGYEAFVFIVNSDNPVDGLTQDEIHGIYTGKYTNWSELGGDFSPINPITRIKGSGSETVMQSFMNGREYKKSLFAFSGRAIGFSFRYYVEDVVAKGGVKMLSIDGVCPDPESISSGEYPLVTSFYAVYDKANDNPNVSAFIDWMLSEEGSRIISETGYIPIDS